ncbi:UvrD-helicase domain-containing protein [Eggerthellaceae bacterium 3-80]|nr:DNA helicase UvrD [bacterium D16-34]
MNLETCTPDQRESICCVARPLLISAGAGSGKTFTLTQRIAYALLPESGPVASDIDEVLAITFTEKAASEIKARVKRTLRQEGLAQEALKVDGAWISTIHGMCSRILRAHALEAGLDPEFTLLSEAETLALRDEVIEEIIGEQDNESCYAYADLFAEYGTKSSFMRGVSVMSLLQELLSKAASLRGGLDVELGPVPLSPSELVKYYLLNCEEFAGALVSAKSGKTVDAARVIMEQSIDACEKFLQEHPECSGTYSQGEPTADLQKEYFKVADLFESLPWISLPSKSSSKEYFRAWQMQATFLLNELQLALARPYADQIMALARDIKSKVDLRKRQLGKLDNDDLLLKTQELFETYPHIAKRYENRFKLVMIDEFQDTSQLQVDMISRMSGENCAHLCTVGDAQQSIYRFRGADIAVYEAHKSSMCSPEIDARYIELKKNFRSHRDVLSFVDSIFSQPRSFGKDFMSLEPHIERASRYVSNDPRINLLLVCLKKKKDATVSAADVKAEKARLIAERFSALREAGHRAGDMVVLLGRMTDAQIYAQALRDADFECVITGGSLFGSAPEVRVLERLVQVLVNPLDGEALFEVLTSDMINLSSDELLYLSSRFDEETQQMRKQSLAKGFRRVAQSEEVCDNALGLALRLFRQAEDELDKLSFSRVVTNVIIRSGWLWRLEQQGATGKAQSANILKALRLLETLEQDRHLAPASLAEVFSAELSEAKEAPGSLSGSGDDVVKIMTIHASKGLEFPIVALAEFEANELSESKLTCLPGEGGLYLSLGSKKSWDQYANLSKNHKNGKNGYLSARYSESGEVTSIDTPSLCLAKATEASQYGYLLYRMACVQDQAEARRKLYVGLTRASEALVVAFDATWSAQQKAYCADVLVEDIRCALTDASDTFFDSDTYDYGGTQSARLFKVMLGESEQSDDDAQDNDIDDDQPEASNSSQTVDDIIETSDGQQSVEEFIVPATPLGFAACVRTPYERGPVFSYSSIADHAPYESVQVTQDQSLDASSETQEAPDDSLNQKDTASQATSLGSAFHRCAQYAIETGMIPDRARQESISHNYALSELQLERLYKACDAYFASESYAQTLNFKYRQAEVPFYVGVEDGYLEGEIDALCFNDATGDAFVIDYKTGGSQAETDEQLHQKHLLQASCYAYALLCGGFTSVVLNFVRVEQLNPSGVMQVVSYAFDVHDKERLAQQIEAQWKKSLDNKE